jgi:hypothetical protein
MGVRTDIIGIEQFTYCAFSVGVFGGLLIIVDSLTLLSTGYRQLSSRL